MIYNIKKFKIKEAFGSGKAVVVVSKLGKILSRRIGKLVTFAEVPIKYENEYGSFSGYLGNVNDEFMLKINFKLTASDSIVSFDIYTGLDVKKPDYTVNTEGLNIVQIVDLLEENLIDDGTVDLNESILKEKRPPTLGDVKSYFPMMDRWTSENDRALNMLQKRTLNDVYVEFLKWARGKPNYEVIKPYFFKKIVKEYLYDLGLTNVTFRQRKKGSMERQVEDPVLQSQLQDLIEDQITVKEKFEMLNALIMQVSNNMINSVIVSGSPGSGKTYETMDTLKRLGKVEGTDYKVYRGGLGSGTDELIRLLWNSQENDIPLLIFDDFDAVWKNSEQKNILKAVLDSGSNREVTYLSKSNNKMLKGIPPQFTFNSSIIFITNVPLEKLDSAVVSRSASISITLSNSEMLERIEEKLEAYMPEVSIDIKKQALEFLKEIHKGVKVVDFRSMNNIIIAIQCGLSNWKKMALMLMTSVS